MENEIWIELQYRWYRRATEPRRQGYQAGGLGKGPPGAGDTLDGGSEAGLALGGGAMPLDPGPGDGPAMGAICAFGLGE